MKRILVAASFAALCVMPAAAQTREPNVPGKAEAPKLDPKACRDRDRLQQGDTVAPRQDETPSDKLARTEGVICPPPEIDPNIRAPAPDTKSSNMPVIPPPGSPDGNPNVRPK